MGALAARHGRLVGTFHVVLTGEGPRARCLPNSLHWLNALQRRWEAADGSKNCFRFRGNPLFKPVFSWPSTRYDERQSSPGGADARAVHDPALWITSWRRGFGGRISPCLKKPARRRESLLLLQVFVAKGICGGLVQPVRVLVAVRAGGGGEWSCAKNTTPP
jgi:hypothetical protein